MRSEPDMYLMVPDDFDDSHADSQVHAMARKMFFGSVMAEPFEKAAQWIAENDVRLSDTSWEIAPADEELYVLSLYFTFEDDHKEG